MKTIPTVLIIAITSLVLAGDGAVKSESPPLPEGKVVGRFQLVAASVDETLGTSETRRYLFRIDTATGQVWRYERTKVPVNIPGHPELKSTEVEAWVETEEDFNHALETQTFSQKKVKSKVEDK